MRFTGPSFIISTSFGYIFRLRVPTDLQNQIGLTEIRRSLKTRSRRKAKTLARSVAGRIQTLYELLRNGNMSLTPDQIKYLIDGYISEALQESESARAKATPLTPQELLEYKAAASCDLKDAWSNLTHFNHDDAKPILEELIAQNGLTLDTDDEAHLSREILKARIDFLRYELARLDGDYRPPEGLFYSGAKEMVTEATIREIFPKANKGPALKTMLAGYKAEMLKARRWSVRTVDEYERAYDMMLRFFGDPPVDQITPAQCREYKETITAMPPNFLTIKKFADVDLHTVRDMRFPKTMSASSCNKYLTCLSQLFDWGVRQGHLTANPAKGLRLPRAKKPREQRKVFDNDDLKSLFGSPEYRTGSFRHDWQRWLPLLGLFTGCRLEELCRSHLSDYRDVDGLPCLDINDEGDRRLKNENSPRIIPLHPYLFDDLGFCNWLDRLRADDHTGRIFPELKEIRHCFGHYPSRWFGKYKKGCGIADEKKAYHSFRHVFSDRLKQNGVSILMIDELTGRAPQGETASRYTERYSPRHLLDKGIMKLDFTAVLEAVKPFR